MGRMINSDKGAHGIRGDVVRGQADVRGLSTESLAPFVAQELLERGASRLTLLSRLQYNSRAHSAWGSAVNCSSRCNVKLLSPGGSSEAVPPVPIPNTAVKRLSADDTAPARTWENRSLPGGFAFSSREDARIESHPRLKGRPTPPYPHPQQRLAETAEGYDPRRAGVSRGSLC